MEQITLSMNQEGMRYRNRAIAVCSVVLIESEGEQGYAAIDIFTCGHGKPHIAAHHLVTFLEPDQILVKGNDRGIQPSGNVVESDGLLEARRSRDA